MRKLEKLNSERIKKDVLDLKPVPTVQALSDDSIQSELLNKKSIPFVSWKEKITYLKSKFLDVKPLEII
jgi:hypothetical protein